MKTTYILLFLVCLFFPLKYTQAQFTEVINSNRPGFSESPYSVGTGIYQVENSFFYQKKEIKTMFSRPESYGVDLYFRTSFFLEKLELNTQISYQSDAIAFHNIFTSQYEKTGIGKFSIGAKYLLHHQEYDDKSKEIRSWKKRFAFDWKRFIPSVAAYLGFNTGLVSEIHKNGGATPKIGVLLQNDFTPNLNLISNIFYDKIGSDFSEIAYIFTATYSFADRWSSFFENQGIFSSYENKLNFGTGLAYLFNRNLQINTSVRYLLENNEGFYASIGISYRINRHIEKE